MDGTHDHDHLEAVTPVARATRGPHLLPDTHSGWWAVAFLLVFLAIVGLGSSSLVPPPAAVAFGVFSAATSIATIVRLGERSLSVYAALLPLVFLGLALMP